MEVNSIGLSVVVSLLSFAHLLGRKVNCHDFFYIVNIIKHLAVTRVRSERTTQAGEVKVKCDVTDAHYRLSLPWLEHSRSFLAAETLTDSPEEKRRSVSAMKAFSQRHTRTARSYPMLIRILSAMLWLREHLRLIYPHVGRSKALIVTIGARGQRRRTAVAAEGSTGQMPQQH